MLQDTPQKDFLKKNITQITQKTIPKSSSYDSFPIKKDNENNCSHSDNELEKTENPFTFSNIPKGFDSNAPIKPARQGPGTSKLATDAIPAQARPPLNRQLSENKAIKKIQAYYGYQTFIDGILYIYFPHFRSLQRTFSTKGNKAANAYAEPISPEEILENDLKVQFKIKSGR